MAPRRSLAIHRIQPHMSEAGMTALLDQHQDFAIRCSNSDPLMFFGPVKELLWVVVDREYRRPPVLRQASMLLRYGLGCGCYTVVDASRTASSAG